MGYKSYILRIRKLEAKVEEAEAKLRELVDAAEWRDECAKDVSISSWWNDKNWAEFARTCERAEAAYQAALKAAKEG